MLIGTGIGAKNQATKNTNEASGDSNYNQPDISEGNGGVDNNKPNHIIATNQVVLTLQSSDKINWKIKNRVTE